MSRDPVLGCGRLGRRPFLGDLKKIAATSFSPELAGFMVPVTAELAPALVGMSLTPRSYLDPVHWEILEAARRRTAERGRLEDKLTRLFHENKPGQAARLDQMSQRGSGQ